MSDGEWESSEYEEEQEQEQEQEQEREQEQEESEEWVTAGELQRIEEEIREYDLCSSHAQRARDGRPFCFFCFTPCIGQGIWYSCRRAEKCGVYYVCGSCEDKFDNRVEDVPLTNRKYYHTLYRIFIHTGDRSQHPMPGMRSVTYE